MKLTDLSPYHQQQFTSVEKIAQNTASPWKNTAENLVNKATHAFIDTHDMLQFLSEIERLHKIEIAGLSEDQDFYKEVQKEQPPLWNDFTAPPAADELQKSLAKKIYNVDPAKQDIAEISLGTQSRKVGPVLVEKCLLDSVPFTVSFREPLFAALLINHTDKKGIMNLAADYVAKMAPCTKTMSVRAGLPDKTIEPDEEKSKLYRQQLSPVGHRTSSGDLFFTLTEIPTPKDAKIDGFEYNDYIRLFFEMCDQPWDYIDKAQQELIKEFNAASDVRITNSDGTDISMDITGFTFANSLIAKNVPGSEIFSAPRRDSVNGKIVAKGRFMHDNEVIENLTLEFNKGKLVKYDADKGLKAFEKAINIDEGARYTGELGIGTNPHLKTHVANGLLVEKIGGSFHMALGKAYTLTEYEGVPVKVDNGNKSVLHWDITTMLHGKEGRIYLDGRLIMDDGKFLDPKYDVLNRGWHAVPEKDRPAYWKNPPKAPTPK